MSHVIVVGGGIVGLATAARLAARGDRVTVLDKEDGLARHQTGRNSGVIHSGLYYPEGSLKARMATAGARSMAAFAAEHGVPVQVCGKLVVATEESELPGLRKLAARAAANKVPARLLDPAQVRAYEPQVRAVAALRVESTGIVDYAGVCRVLAGQIEAAGGRILLGEAMLAARTVGARVQVRTSVTDREADGLVVCGGLHADRLARASGLNPAARIVPFRGEYYSLSAAAAELVHGLIYPVPDPRFPFLGVHLTRGIDGHVHAGPNAVLALAREGYTWGKVSARDVGDALSWPGLWRMGARNWRPGAAEVLRSLSPAAFARSLSRLVPGITADDLVPAPAGVRAQAVRRDGGLVDDFLGADGTGPGARAERPVTGGDGSVGDRGAPGRGTGRGAAGRGAGAPGGEELSGTRAGRAEGAGGRWCTALSGPAPHDRRPATGIGGVRRPPSAGRRWR